MKRFRNPYYGKTKLLKGSAEDNTGAPSNVKDSLLQLKSLFPVEKFDNNLPPIIMKHQLYALISNRTEVDQKINDMQHKDEIRLFKLGATGEEFAVVFMKDYKEHLNKTCGKNATIAQFLQNVIEKCVDISFSKDILFKRYGLKGEDISVLVQNGVLTIRDSGCWWLSIPNAGEFVKSLIAGRKYLLSSIERTKFSEMLQTELEQRKLPKTAKLSIAYHIYDIIGADLVKCVNTTSGKLLRVQDED